MSRRPYYQRVGRELHDRCMRACWHVKGLSDADKVALNKVAIGWALNEDVPIRDIDKASIILTRLELENDSL